MGAAETNEGPVIPINAAHAIVSDIDNTLLGDDDALARFASWRADAGRETALIYASGRFFESIVDSVESTDLPEPDLVIGGVGTEMRVFDSGEPIVSWTGRFEDRFDAAIVREALDGFPGLEEQPPALCSRYKASYYLEGAGQSELHQVRERVADAGIDAEIVYSSDRDLDVLPAGVNKGSAARHAVEALGIDRDHVVVCGDSANDLSMFRHGFRGVVVGNAHESLKALELPTVHQAEAEYAAGVIEGLERWGEDLPGLAGPMTPALAGA